MGFRGGRRTPAAGDAFWQDPFTLRGGAQKLRLTYDPVPYSHHVYWSRGGAGPGLYQPEGVAWSVSGRNVLVLDAGPVRPATGDLVVVEYAWAPPQVASPYPPWVDAVTAAGPAWWFRFDDPTQVIDSSGRGVSPGAAGVAGYGSTTSCPGLLLAAKAGTGLARRFAGDQAVTAQYGTAANAWLTWSALVQPQAGQASDGIVIGAMSSIAGAHTGYLGISATGRATLRLYGGALESSPLVGGPDLRDGKPHLVTATYSGAGALYVDGALVASGNQGGTRPAGVWTMGEGLVNHDFRFVGVMDEPMMFARALTAGEVLDLFNSSRAAV